MERFKAVRDKNMYPISGQYSHFKPPENTIKTKGFLVFSGGIKWENWPEIG